MKQNIFYSSLLFLGLFCASASAAVVITEFMYDPTSGQVVGSGSGDDHWEWVEIYNNGSSAVDLQNWQLDDVTGGGGTPVDITLSSISINPGAYIVLTEQTVADFNTEWNTSLTDNVDLIELANIPELDNGGDTIRLIDGTATEVFSLTYVNAAFTGRSLGFFGVLDDDSEFEDDTNWADAFYLSNSFQADGIDYGSPGEFNGALVPEPSTVVLFLLGGLLINRRLREDYL